MKVLILTAFLMTSTAMAEDLLIGIKTEGSANDLVSCLQGIKKIQYRAKPEGTVIVPIVIVVSRPNRLTVRLSLTAEGAAEVATLSCVKYVEVDGTVYPLPSLGTGN